MKFEDAFNKVAENYDEIKKRNPGFDGAVTREGLDAVMLAWNMISLAQNEKGLDDFVFMNNKGFNSISLKETVKTDDSNKTDKKESKKSNKKEKGKSPNQETATNEKVDVKEKQKETNSEPPAE